MTINKNFANEEMDDLKKRLHKFNELSKELNQNYKISSVEDAKDYLYKLNKLQVLRKIMMNNIGTGFEKIVHNYLSVGSDSQYSEEFRAIYELIQNVDDCKYDDLTNCELEILFDIKKNIVTLEYNELGFTSQNVFGIASIAESNKNLDGQEIQIGEKGIGFKSVFGIADKVIIQSGYFSFSFNTDDFIIPNLEYDNYKYTKGTKLTLFLKSGKAKELFNEIISKYNYSENISKYLNDNPVIFLNKLTRVTYKNELGEYVSFGVTRNPKENIDFKIEKNVKLTIEKKKYNSEPQKVVLNCYRFSSKVKYDEELCKSRYGKNCGFKERTHNIIALILKDHVFGGRVYSFLPTNINTVVPITFHIPFKLDSSREGIDNQDGNLWFRHTVSELRRFVKNMYIELGKLEPSNIFNYLPKNNYHSLFAADTKNQKYFISNAFSLNKEVEGLDITYSRWEETISDYKIIKISDGTFKSIKELCYIPNIDTQTSELILEFLGETKHVVSANNQIEYKNYNIEEKQGVLNDLFKKFLNENSKSKDIVALFDLIDLKILIKNLNIFPATKNKEKKLILNPQLLSLIMQGNNLKKIIMDNNLSNELKQQIFIVGNWDNIVDDENSDFINDSIKTYRNSKNLGVIYKISNFDFKKVNGWKSGSYFISNNVFYYSDIFNDIIDFFANFDKKVKFSDSEKMAFAFIMIEKESYEFKYALNNNKDDPETFIHKLKSKNEVSKRILGRTYDKLLKIIDNSSVNQDIYLNELIQNANDCSYRKNEIPTLSILKDDNRLIVEYNELGFTKEDIRAITEIGESTKTKIVNSDNLNNVIGEKGIGFKSVFKIADKVVIHSGEYHFEILKKAPTIPVWSYGNKYQNGTKIEISLKGNIKDYKLEDIVILFLGISKLRKIKFFNHLIEIQESNNEKIITIDGKKYEFYLFTNYEKVNDSVLECRKINKPNEKQEQQIHLYFPKSIKMFKKGYLYTGLPTTVETNFPFSINASFELNTSREGIVENKWNDDLFRCINMSLQKAFDYFKTSLDLKIFDYLDDQKLINQNNFSHNKNILDILSNVELLKNTQGNWIKVCGSIIVNPLEEKVFKELDLTFNENCVVLNEKQVCRYKSVFNKMKSIIESDIELITELIEEYNFHESFLKNDEKMRNDFYDIIKKSNNKDEYFDLFEKYDLVPSIGIDKELLFTSSKSDIYFSNENEISEPGLYYILATDILDKKTFNEITENEYDEIERFGDEEREKYNAERVKKWLEIEDLEERANRFLNEFNKNSKNILSIINDFNKIDFHKIPFKTRANTFSLNTWLYVYEDENYSYSKQIIDKEYENFASQIGIMKLEDISCYDEYPFKSINDDELLLDTFKIDFNYAENLYYDLLLKDKISNELIKEYFFDIIQEAGINIGKLKGITFNNSIWTTLTEDLDLIEHISVNCDNITFDFLEEFKEYDMLREDLIKEICFEIDLTNKLESSSKQRIKKWINKDVIKDTTLPRTVIINTAKGPRIYLGRNVKTEKETFDILSKFLKNNFNYSLSLNKTMNPYSRLLVKRIGNNKYIINDGVILSKSIQTHFNQIEDEKRLLCEPIKYKSVVYGGYAKRCPCCGARVHTELTGFRIAKLRQTYPINGEDVNIKFDIPCCQNCFDAFLYADTYEINIKKFIDEGMIEMYVKLCGEIWSPTVFKPRLAHYALLLAMNDRLKLEIEKH